VKLSVLVRLNQWIYQRKLLFNSREGNQIIASAIL